MNFSAFEYWTDGWRDGSLMPNDEGLRRCNCGRFVLLKDLVKNETAEASDLPRMNHVPDDLLPECIANADSEDLEAAARLGYLSVQALREWCTKHGVSEPEIVRTARKEGVLIAHDRLKGPKGTERKMVAVSAEYYNLAKGLKDSMELKCRVYTIDVRKLYQMLGTDMDDFTGAEKGTNVVALHTPPPEETPPAQENAA